MQNQESKKDNSLEPQIGKIEKDSIAPYPYQRFSVKITIISMFAALAIGASYILAPLINIELMSVLLFIAGFLYGKYVGIFVGLISSIIYYGWNPFGVSPLPMYITCVGCMAFIGLLGGILNASQTKKKKIDIKLSNIAKLALIGFFFTLLFDILTNLIYAYIYYAGNIHLAFITGLPFMIIHLISNTIIFALLVLPTYNTIISTS